MTSEAIASDPQEPQTGAPGGSAVDPADPAQGPDLADVWHARQVAEELAGVLENGYFAAQDADREQLDDGERGAVVTLAEELRGLLARVLA